MSYSHSSVSISSSTSSSGASFERSASSSSSSLNQEILKSSILSLQGESTTIYYCNCMDWKNKPHQIFNKVKQQMYGKGVETFHFVDQFIEQFDPQRTGLLSSHFFNLFLNKVGVFLTTQEIRNIRDLYCSSKGEDSILYRDFFEDVKYSMSEKLAQLVGFAYDSIDKNNQGSVSLTILENENIYGKHPHVLSRLKSPEQIKSEFMSGISRKADKNGRVDKKGFLDYYAELNFCIPNERQSFFEQLIVNSWNLKHPEDYVSEKRLKEIELTLYEKIREKSDGKTNEWKTAKKALFYFDLEDRKNCHFVQFKQGLDKFGCNFKEHELKALFLKYSTNDVLDYETFSKAIMDIDINGMMTQPNLLSTKMGTNHFKVTH